MKAIVVFEPGDFDLDQEHQGNRPEVEAFALLVLRVLMVEYFGPFVGSVTVDSTSSLDLERPLE